MAISRTSWVTDEEKRTIFPCDRLRDDFDPLHSILRGITPNTASQMVCEWLNQL